MTRVSKATHNPIDTLSAAAAAAGTDLFRVDQLGLDELKMTLAQLATFMSSNLGSPTMDDITVSSISITSLTAAGSAMTFSTTGQTSGAVAAVTSSAGSWGFASKGQVEFLVEEVKNHRAVLDELRS